MFASLADGRLLPLALLVSLALTRLVIGLAHRYHWVAAPKADRWHQQPTALYGGVAIFLTFAAGCLLLLADPAHARRLDLFGLLLGGLIIFAVGLWDDVHSLSPRIKLMGQIAAAVPFLIGVGFLYTAYTGTYTGSWLAFACCVPILLFWMVALTNAFNLLDNMDGLSAGTATIVGVVLAAFCYLHPSQDNGIVSLLCALIAASCLGFLCFNFRLGERKARIFMGDCGSMFLGYMLAGLTIIGVSNSGPDKPGALALPLLFMALPIFDTTLVTIIRRREGRAISQGGKDHSSHRLVYAGLTEKQAVLLLYVISLIDGAAALCVATLRNPPVTVITVLLCALGLSGLGIFLSRFAAEPKPIVSGLDANPS